MSQITEQDFNNFFKYYKDEEHQKEATSKLYQGLPDALKDETADWIVTYRTPKVPETGPTTNPLDVPFQSQNDNISGTGYRECFSSSCAMVAMYYGKIKNDDAYNEVRAKFGDSTDAQAQVRALRSLGLEANFITNAGTADLKAAIDAGRPCPAGWLHHGSVNSPSGGGHYSVIIGYSDEVGCWIVNDPNGEANLVGGGYTDNLNGDHLNYSYKNWNPRWIVEGEGSGWMMDIRDPAHKPQPSSDVSITSVDGVNLIKQFEGCELTAYPDPGTGGDPFTVGFGHTGPDVYPGLTISADRAEQLLVEDLHRFERAVRAHIKVTLTQHEFDAIVSFTYNVGEGALASSTFCRRMNAGENKAACFAEEFPKWVNGANGPLPGLVRRRDAEVELSQSP